MTKARPAALRRRETWRRPVWSGPSGVSVVLRRFVEWSRADDKRCHGRGSPAQLDDSFDQPGRIKPGGAHGGLAREAPAVEDTSPHFGAPT